MIRSVLGLPLRLLRRIFGKKAAPPAVPPRPVSRPTPPSRPPAAEADGDAHAHSHGHSHGHSHAHEREEPPPPPPPQDDDHHGHSHPHDHGHAPPAKAKVQVYAEDTPNPNARKFTCSVRVVEKGSLSFNGAEDAAGHAFAGALFSITGVKSVFAVKDFVTVTRAADADWAVLTPKITAVLAEKLGG